MEYALRESSKPIGVATYRILSSVPEELRNDLPAPETIILRWLNHVQFTPSRLADAGIVLASLAVRARRESSCDASDWGRGREDADTGQSSRARRQKGHKRIGTLDVSRGRVSSRNASPVAARNDPELLSFNWGAFFLTWIWAIGNKTFNRVTLVLALCCLIPYFGVASAIALAVYSGKTGNKRAWQSREWKSADHFVKIQRWWTRVGAAQFAVAVLFVVFLAVWAER